MGRTVGGRRRKHGCGGATRRGFARGRPRRRRRDHERRCDERGGDVPLLATHFLARHNAGKQDPLRFSAAAIEALERHSWPGNVRELENLVERLAVLKGEGEIDVVDLPGPIRNARGAPAGAERADIPTALPPEGVDLYKVLADIEDRLIREALERSGGNKNQAAKILGLNRTTLVEKLRKKGALKGSGSAES